MIGSRGGRRPLLECVADYLQALVAPNTAQLQSGTWPEESVSVGASRCYSGDNRAAAQCVDPTPSQVLTRWMIIGVAIDRVGEGQGEFCCAIGSHHELFVLQRIQACAIGSSPMFYTEFLCRQPSAMVIVPLWWLSSDSHKVPFAGGPTMAELQGICAPRQPCGLYSGDFSPQVDIFHRGYEEMIERTAQSDESGNMVDPK